MKLVSVTQWVSARQRAIPIRGGKHYGEELEANLVDFHARLREQRYIAPPIKRVWIEKDVGKEATDRTIGDQTQNSQESGSDANGRGV